MVASISRKVNCYNNAPMVESFWGSLKNDLEQYLRYATRDEAKASIQEYIEIFSIAKGCILGCGMLHRHYLQPITTK